MLFFAACQLASDRVSQVVAHNSMSVPCCGLIMRLLSDASLKQLVAGVRSCCIGRR